MKYGFDYEEYNAFEKQISKFEEKIIIDQFNTMIDPENNDGFEDMSSAELKHNFYVFRHGWICNSLMRKD